MYVENEKISDRQTFRLFVFDLLGIATLLLPPYLAKLTGVDGIFAILLGGTSGYIYLRYLPAEYERIYKIPDQLLLQFL